MNIYQAQLISFVTVLADRELNEYEINNLTDRVKAVTTPNQVAVEQLELMLKSMSNGMKIEAIKSYRTMTNASLLDAKNAIERYYVNKPAEKV